MNVVNDFSATKETSEYHLTKKYSCLHKQLQVDAIDHLLSPLDHYEVQAPN